MDKLRTYFRNSYVEFAQKATWPKLADLQKSTVLVIVASIIFALVIFVMDRGITAILDFIRSLFA